MSKTDYSTYAADGWTYEKACAVLKLDVEKYSPCAIARTARIKAGYTGARPAERVAADVIDAYMADDAAAELDANMAVVMEDA